MPYKTAQRPILAALRAWVVLALVVIAGVLAPASASAAARAFTNSYAQTLHGDIATIGNANSTCAAGWSTCNRAALGSHNSTEGYGALIDIDGAAANTTNSSTSSLAIPAGAVVRSARLVWGSAGDGTDGNGENTVRFDTPATPGYAYANVSAGTACGSITNAAGSNNRGFACSADVTAAVLAAGSGAYTVGAIEQRGTAGGDLPDHWSGWNLYVAFELGSEPLRRLVLADGFQRVQTGASTTITATGFVAPASGTVTARLTYSVGEGDSGIAGDNATFGSRSLDTVAPIDLMESTIRGLDFESSRAPSNLNNYGFDLHSDEINGAIGNGATSAAFVFNTTQDVYYPFSLGIAIELGEPELVLTKTLTDVNGGVVEPGDILEYQIVAQNQGNDGAAAVTVTDPIPANTTYVPGSMQVTAGANAGTKTDVADADQGNFTASPTPQVTMRLGTGASGTNGGILTAGGGTSTVRFRVRIATAADEGVPLVNTASGSYIGQTSLLSYADPSSVAATPVRRADMVVAQTLSPAMTNGQGGTVTLTASNIGGAQTYGQPVTVAATIPAGVTLNGVSSAPGWNCTPSGATVSCTRTDALLATSAYPDIVLDVTPSQTAPSATFAAQVSGGNEVRTNNNADTDAVTFVRSANLRVTKAVDATASRVGDTLTYTLVASNLGPSNTTGVTVVDPLPATLQPLTATATQGSCATTGQNVSCAVGALTSGASATITITARVLPAGVASTITNGASISGPDPDPAPANDSATAATTIGQAADLHVTKVVSPTSVNVGAIATWTVDVRNDGPGSAPAVSVLDDLPAGFTVSSITTSQGTCGSGDPFTCALGTIASGATATITVVGRPARSVAGTTLTNTATATSTAWDPDGTDDSASASLAVPPAADLAVTKTADKATANVDELITWTVALENTGVSAAVGATVTDTAPAGVTIQSVTPQAGLTCSTAGQVISCSSAAPFPAGAQRTVTIVARVNRSSAGSPLSNSATASSSTFDPDLANNLSSVTTNVNAAADLRVTKTADRATANVGGAITWTVTATNDGASPATGVQLTDVLPTGVTLTGPAPQASQGPACSVVGGQVVCAIGTLAVGASATLTLTARVERTAAETPLQNVAQITGAQFDPDTANNSTSVSSPVPATADLRLTKTASNASRNVGDALSYTLTAFNDGPSTATNVQIADTVPVGFQLTAAPTVTGGTCTVTGRSVLCTVPSLASGGSRTVTLAGQVTAAAAGTVLSNTASISGTQPDQDPSNNATPPVTTNVGGVAELAITKTVNTAAANVGSTLTYTLSVTNSGPQAATNTVVTDTLPAGLTRLGATSTLGSCPAGTPIVCNLGTVPVGTTVTITITASVGLGAAGTTATNSATVDSPLDDLNPANDTATATTTIAPAADLRVVKIADRATADVGQTIIWTVTATNDGPSTATGVSVVDTIPAGVSLQTPITGLPAGVTCTPSGQVVSCSIAGSMASGDSRTITLRGTVQRAAAETPQENVATIAGNQLDPNTANNTSRVTTNVNAAADLRVTKTVNVASANVGDTLSWTVAVTNDGPSVATAVQLIDDLPAGTTLLTRAISQGTCNPVPTVNPTQVICAVGTLAPGQTATATITSRVERARAESPVNNVARATATQLDPDTANNLSTATTAIGPSTDLQLQMVVDKPNANVGETVIYDVMVRNDGPSTATGIVLTDVLPSTLQGTGAITSTGGPCSGSGQTITCTIASLPANAFVMVRFQAIVRSSGGASTITNTATVTGGQSDPTPANNTASVNTAIPASADTSIVTSVDRATASVGDTLTYTFTARNDGPQAATGFQLVGTIPAGLTVLTSSAPGLSCSGSPITCAGTLASGATATLTVTARVNTAASGQTLTALGTVSATPYDPTPLNNSDDAVTAVRPAADLQITKSANRTAANIGDLITYTVRVDNAGPAAATGVTVTDAVPASLQIVGTPTSTIGTCTVAGQNVTCTPNSLANGASATITIVGRVLSAAAGTTVANTASVDGAQDDPTPANDTSLATSTTVAGAADVAVVTSVNQPTADVGEILTYTFVATNNGPQSATGLQLQGTLPPGFTLVGTPSATGGLTCSGNPVSCTGTLANGASATLTVQGRVGVTASGTTATAVGVVSATPFDAVSANNADDATTTIRPAADLRATKTVDRATANIGDLLTYTLRVDNDGPAGATGVTLVDTLPSALQIVGTPTASQGTCSVSGQTVNCAVGTVPNGAAATATVVARVLASASATTVSNAVTVDGAQFDQTPANDVSAPATTSVGSVADVAVVTSVNQTTANVGETLTYTYVATNNGPQTAAGFALQAVVPAGMTITGTPTVTGGLTCTGSPISCTGSLANGASATLTVQAIVPLVASGSTLTAVGTVSATPLDPVSANNTDDAATAIRPAADLRATKTADRATANVGDLITYTLRAENAGPAAATGATLTDTLPATLQLVGAPTASQGTCTASGQTVTCTVGALASGANATATVVARVLTSAANATVANTATVDGDQFDPTPSNDTAPGASTLIGPVADVAVLTSVSQATANVGDTLSYTFAATNNGPQSAAGFTLTGTLPAGLTVLTTTPPAGLTCTGSPIACTGTLAAGATATLTVTARVNTAASAQTLTALGTVSTTTFDPIAANNADDAVTAIRPAADLRASKTVDKTSANIGELLTYTLRADNAGPAAATGVTLTDTLPNTLQIVGTPTASQGTCAVSGQTVTCAVGTVPNAGSATATIVARVLPAAANGSVANAATVDGNETDPTPANDSSVPATTSINAVADVAVVTSIDQTTASVGDLLTFTFAARNNGPQLAGGFTLTGTLPAGVTLVGSPSATGGLTCSGSPITCVGTLANGATATLTATARVNSAASASTLTALGTVSTTTFDPASANNSSNATTAIRPAADLRISKSADKPSANIGDLITYALRADNAGPAGATGVTLTDTVPAALQIVGTPTASQGTCTVTGQAVTCAVGSLANGGFATATIVTRVLPSAVGSTVANSASVDGNETDPTPANDASLPTSTSIGAAADVAVVTSVSAPTADVGDTLTYTFTARNNGPSTAGGFQLVAAIPAGLTVLTSSAPGLACTGSPITCTGSLANGTTATLTVTARVSTTASGQTLAAQGTVNATPFDPVALNNADDAVTAIRPAADLRLSKSADKTSANIGELVTFALRADNDGPGAATGVTITDTLPASLQAVGTPTVTQGGCAVSGQTITCSVGGLANGASATATIITRVRPAGANSSIANIATVDGDQTDPTPGNDTSIPTTTTIGPAADLVVSQTVSDPSINLGDSVDYVVTVRNDGPQAASGVNLLDDLPTGGTLVSITPSQGTCGTGDPFSCALGALAPGTSATITVRVQIVGAASSTFANVASATATQFDPKTANNAATVGTSTSPAADLRIVKTADKTTADVGETITWTVTATNDGPSAASGVTITDTAPGGVTLLPVTDPASSSCTTAGQTVTCARAGSVPVGGTVVLTLRGTVNTAAAGSPQANSATVGGNEFDPDTANNLSAVTTNVNAAADLRVAKTVNTATANVGDTLTWSIVATNDGPSTATAVVATDNLPSGVTLLSRTASQGTCTPSGAQVVCAIGALASGVSATITLTGRVDRAAAESPVSNVATVTSGVFDPDPADNLSTATTTVGPAADLRLAKSVDKPSANVGETLTYTLTATNDGPSSATDAAVTDTLPSGLAITGTPTSSQGACSVTGQNVTCSVGTLPSGAAATITIVATVRPSASATTIANTAAVSGSRLDPDPSNDTTTAATTTIAAAADLAVTHTVDDASVNLGDVVEYTVRVGNDGPSAATGVRLTDDLPAGTTLISRSTSQGTCAAGGDPLSCTLGTIAPGGEAVIVVRLRLDTGASAAFTSTATAAGTEFDPTPANNAASASASTGPAANLSLVKTADKPTADVGETITWTLTASNAGPSAASGVTVTDTLPAGITGVTATGGAGVTCTIAAGTASCAITGPWAAGTNRTIQLTGQVARSSAGSPLTNAATIAGGEFDPDPADNLSSVTTNVNAAADLRVTKTADRATANVGNTITWTVTATNDGPSAAPAVSIIDDLPAGVTLISATSPLGACAPVGAQLVCGPGALTSGQSAAATITGRVEVAAAESPVVNAARVTSPTFDPDTANNLSTVSTAVGKSIDLSTSAAVDKPTANMGEELLYTFTVANAGPSSATGTSFTHVLPANVTYVGATSSQGGCSVASGTVTCALGTVAGAGNATITVRVRVDAPAAGTTIDARGAVSATEPDRVPANDESIVVSTAVAAAADLAVTTTADRTTAAVGDTVTYLVSVTNQGPSTATGVTLTNQIPPGATVLAVTPSAGVTCGTADPRVCAVGTLAPNASATVEVVVRTTAANAGSLVTDRASATADQFDPVTGNNAAQASAAVGDAADLRIVKTADRSTAEVGDTITWTLTASNLGPMGATGVAVTDAIPQGITILAATSSAGTCAVGAPASCQLGSLANGASATITIVGRVDRAAAGSPLAGQAVITGDQLDPAPANNVSTAAVTVGPAADLRITKLVDRPAPAIGDAVEWTIQVFNDGPQSAANAQVTDVVPAGAPISSVSASVGSCARTGQSVVCDLGTLASGASATVTIRATVAGSAGGAVLDNAASTSSGTRDPDTANNTATARATAGAAADLSVTLSPDRPSATVGEAITWTAVVGNAGAQRGTGVVATVTIPAGIEGITATTPGGACVIREQVVTCTVADVPVGGSQSITIKGTAGRETAERSLVADAVVTGTLPDPNPADNAASAGLVTVPAAVDLVVTKTSDRENAGVGEKVTITTDILNRGPSTATDVVLTDTLPEGVTLDSVTPSQGACMVSERTITCKLGDVADGQTASIKLVVAVDVAGSDQQLLNAGTATSGEFDTDGANNVARITTGGQNPPPAGAKAPLIELTKTVDKAAVTAGSPVVFTITATNRGNGDASGVRITDALPAGLDYVSTKGAGVTCSRAARTITCVATTLPAGRSVSVKITTQVAIAGKPIENVASVTAAGLPEAGAKGQRATAQVRGSGAPYVVAGIKPLEAYTRPGKTVRIAVKVTNVGQAGANDVQACFTLPKGVVLLRKPAGLSQRGAKFCLAAARLDVDKNKRIVLSARVVGGAGTSRPKITGTSSNSRVKTEAYPLVVRGQRATRGSGVTG